MQRGEQGKLSQRPEPPPVTKKIEAFSFASALIQMAKLPNYLEEKRNRQKCIHFSHGSTYDQPTPLLG